MTRTFEEMCAERDPLYAALKPAGVLAIAIMLDTAATEARHPFLLERARNEVLFTLAIKALKRDRRP